MAEYFDDIHSMPEFEFYDRPSGIEDNAQVAALRGMPGYSGKMALAKALCGQLRYREAIEVYNEVIAMDPMDPEAYRQRAARYITTMQPEKAVADFEFFLPTSFERGDTLYRQGIAYYLANDYEHCMQVEEEAFGRFDDEMGIAAMYWYVLAAYRLGKEPVLLEKYHDDMQVGHHTSYTFAMRLCTGRIGIEEALEEIKKEPEDLEYAMQGYGIYVYAEAHGQLDQVDGLLESIVKRDGFWIGYGYLAAWNDYYRNGKR